MALRGTETIFRIWVLEVQSLKGSLDMGMVTLATCICPTTAMRQTDHFCRVLPPRSSVWAQA